MLRMTRSAVLHALGAFLALAAAAIAPSRALAIVPSKHPVPAKGPLRVHPDNPRYFTDGTKRPGGSLNAVYLAGFQFWDVFDDRGGPSPEGMEFEEFLRIAEKYGANFVRLWRWNELTRFKYGREDAANFTLHPWARTGPENALDGRPKFNLEQFNQAYFDLLRSRVIQARARGMYVAVMLFEGWSLRNAATPWASEGHPFHEQNNINGIAGDVDGDLRVMETHTLKIPAVNAIQEAYVRKVIDTLNDLDNVLYEISNEDGDYSVEWQYQMIRLIKEYQASKPRRHLVGMTCLGVDDLSPAENMVRRALLDSPADWISPYTKAPAGFDYRDNPPPAEGKKVIISDTDHLAGRALDATWVWKSFTRGLSVNNYMELKDLKVDTPRLEGARRAVGQTRRFAERINLAATTPANDLASTDYCLTDLGREYLVFLPGGGGVTVDLSAVNGELAVEWFDPANDKGMAAAPVSGGGKREMKAPFEGPAVLYLSPRAK